MSDIEDTGIEAYKLASTKTFSELSIPKRDSDPLITKTTENSLNVVDQINKISLINPRDLLDLEKSKAFLVSTYSDVPQYRPMVVKVASVLDDGRLPTADSKFWQCKKEAEVHFNELVSNVYKWQISQIDLEEMDYKIASLEALLKEDNVRSDLDPKLIEFDVRRMKVKRERYEFNIKQLEKNIKYRIEEVTDWAAIANTIESDCKHSTTNAQEYYVESFYKRLEYEIENATDEKAKLNFTSQLNTLRKIMKQKMKDVMNKQKKES